MNNLPPEFLDDVEKFNKQLLKRKNDLLLLVKTYDKTNRAEDFENLCFTGKYVNGLFNVLKNSINVSEAANFDNIRKDLTENLEKVTSALKEVTFFMSDDEKKIITENYLIFNQGTLQNIQQLVEDLNQIKKYLNFIKRQ